MPQRDNTAVLLSVATGNVTSCTHETARKSYDYVGEMLDSGFDNYLPHPLEYRPHIFAIQELQAQPTKSREWYGLARQDGYDYQMYTAGVEQKEVVMAIATNFVMTMPSLHCGLNPDDRILTGKFRHRDCDTPFVSANYYGRVMEAHSNPPKRCWALDQFASVGRLFSAVSEICLKEQCCNYIVMGDFNGVPLHLRRYDLVKNYNLYFRTCDGDDLPLPTLWPPRLLRVDYDNCGGDQTRLEHSTNCDYIFVFGELFQSETASSLVPAGVTPMDHKLVHTTLNLANTSCCRKYCP